VRLKNISPQSVQVVKYMIVLVVLDHSTISLVMFVS